MVQFLSINFFLEFLQFLLGFSKVSVFFVSSCIYSENMGHIQTSERVLAHETLKLQNLLMNPHMYTVRQVYNLVTAFFYLLLVYL